jgi:pyruvate-formate lyase-activating enzyme
VRPRRYAGTLIAPYWRFRRAHDGTYGADIMGCGWTCDRCWSKFGWHTLPPNYELSPHEVVARIPEHEPRLTLTGGEPLMWWPHVRALAQCWLEERGGALVIETSGALSVPDWLGQLDAMDDAERLIVRFGLKATNPEALAALTGMQLHAARAAHDRQISALNRAVYECDRLCPQITVLDRFTDLAEYGQLVDAVMDGRGSERPYEVLEFTRYGNTMQFYAPKRHRRERERG